MSKAYPNYQNKSYSDYIKFVKENELFLDKLRLSRAIVDDQCPESFNNIKNRGKLHKHYNYLGSLQILILTKTISSNKTKKYRKGEGEVKGK